MPVIISASRRTDILRYYPDFFANRRKAGFVEFRNAFGGKGSESHTAAVIGDTVGDPFKDTSGPAMNIVIKVMTIVSLIFASAFVG